MGRSSVKYSIITFGCRVNQADSLAIEHELAGHGAVAVPPEAADLLVVNSCSVTAAADQGVRQTIRRIARRNPGVKVVVTGCYATRRPAEVAALPNVVRVVRNDDKDGLASLVADGLGLTTAERFGAGSGPCGAPLEPGLGGRTAFTIRVQTGCDERCSYCIIPTTRGRGRSAPPGRVLAEISRAVSAGYKEIVITGVHLGSYGRDLGDGTSLAGLLGALADWPGDVLFRVSSLEPMDCGDDLVDLIATSPQLAPHFHLPLQHGSDRVLRAMRRPYTAAAYARLVEGIVSRMPHASIGSDVIVGFPGEGDDDFREMYAFVSRLPLSHLHVFPYSDRPSTDASGLAPKVGGAAVRERGLAMRALGATMAERFRRRQSGTTRRALTIGDGWWAVTDNYLKVRLDRQRRRNEWLEVTIT
jgi:threonylcarbamoyladenosine tRNA methylthiotransferase MtaB